MDFRLNLATETVSRLDALEPLCVEPAVSVRAVLTLLQARRRAGVLVCRAGTLIGIFTERDALRLMATGADLGVPIERVMVADPVVLSPQDTIAHAIAKLAHGGYRRAPLVDKQRRPLGMVSVKHILHYLVQHFPAVVYTLPPAPDHPTQEREGA